MIVESQSHGRTEPLIHDPFRTNSTWQQLYHHAQPKVNLRLNSLLFPSLDSPGNDDRDCATEPEPGVKLRRSPFLNSLAENDKLGPGASKHCKASSLGISVMGWRCGSERGGAGRCSMI